MAILDLYGNVIGVAGNIAAAKEIMHREAGYDGAIEIKSGVNAGTWLAFVDGEPIGSFKEYEVEK